MKEKTSELNKSRQRAIFWKKLIALAIFLLILLIAVLYKSGYVGFIKVIYL